MKALEVTGVSELVMKEIDKPVIKDKEVLVKVAYCGICGSDLPRYFQGGVHSFPQVLGHEFSGVVDSVGSQVTDIKVGDRVAVAPLIPCGHCENCQKGEPAMCTNYSFIGSREQGAMAEYIAVPKENCVQIPDSLSLKEAALLEPLTVAIHGIERVNIKAGARVLVLGAGTIGLLTILALRARGVGEISVIDINNHKLELATLIGADKVINSSVQDLDEYYATNKKPEVVIETAGSPITQQQAVKYSTKRGKVVFVGTCTKDIVFSPETFESILRGELELTGSWMSYSAPFPGYEWTSGLRYMAKGEIDVKPLISGIYKLSDCEKPFYRMVEKDGSAVKLLYGIDENLV